jgi:hypothetical protein
MNRTGADDKLPRAMNDGGGRINALTRTKDDDALSTRVQGRDPLEAGTE